MVEAPARASFNEVIETAEALRDLLGWPSETVVRKQLPALDHHSRAFIALSPLLLLGTANSDGDCDVSPRGDAPGFVLVLDERTIVIPERPGNRRSDSLRNIISTKRAGLLLLAPGVEETLRVNGRATLIRDESILERMAARGKRPLLGIAIEVEEVFFHCAKAFKRSQLWDAATWPAREELPTLAQIIFDQVHPPGLTIDDLERQIAEGYAKRLY